MTGDEDVIANRIKAALLVEYPWNEHDDWHEDNVREHKHPWPHLDHVAAVAAHAALSDRPLTDAERDALQRDIRPGHLPDQEAST